MSFLSKVINFTFDAEIFPSLDVQKFLPDELLDKTGIRGRDPFEELPPRFKHGPAGFGYILGGGTLPPFWLSKFCNEFNFDFIDLVTEILSHYEVAIYESAPSHEEFAHTSTLYKCKPSNMKIVSSECVNSIQRLIDPNPEILRLREYELPRCDLHLSNVPGTGAATSMIYGTPTSFVVWPLPSELIPDKIPSWEMRSGLVSCANGIDHADLYAAYLARAIGTPIHIHSYGSEHDSTSLVNSMMKMIPKYVWKDAIVNYYSTPKAFAQKVEYARCCLCLKLVPTWGRTIIEAAGLGTPTVSTKSGGSVIWPELTVEWDDFETVARLTKNIVEDVDYFNELSIKGRNWVKEHSIDKFRTQFLSLLGEHVFPERSLV